MNTIFQATIMCPLANVPELEPEFYWSIFYNDTELKLNSLPSLQVFNESDMLILNGTIGLGENGTLNINCTVESQYGSDTENTRISICGQKSLLCI